MKFNDIDLEDLDKPFVCHKHIVHSKCLNKTKVSNLQAYIPLEFIWLL